MWNVIEIPPARDTLSIELQHLRVVAYCRVSTEPKEYISSIKL